MLNIYALYPEEYSGRFMILLFVLTMLIAVIGGCVLYMLFISTPNKYKGAVAYLHDLLSFREFLAEELLRLLYAILIVGLTAHCVFRAFTSLLEALSLFVCGQIALRILFELVMLFIDLCTNVHTLCQTVFEQDSEICEEENDMDETADVAVSDFASMSVGEEASKGGKPKSGVSDKEGGVPPV